MKPEMKSALIGSTAMVTPLDQDRDSNILFTDKNVREALAMAQAIHFRSGNPMDAMRKLMMFALRCAAINLDVKPTASKE